MMLCCEQFIAGTLPCPVEGGEVYEYEAIDADDNIDLESGERKRDIEDAYVTTV